MRESVIRNRYPNQLKNGQVKTTTTENTRSDSSKNAEWKPLLALKRETTLDVFEKQLATSTGEMDSTINESCSSPA